MIAVVLRISIESSTAMDANMLTKPTLSHSSILSTNALITFNRKDALQFASDYSNN